MHSRTLPARPETPEIEKTAGLNDQRPTAADDKWIDPKNRPPSTRKPGDCAGPHEEHDG